MAYMDQEKKAKIAAKIKPILKKYGMKGTLSVHNHMSIVLTLKSGKINFEGRDHVNPYWFHEHYTGTAKDFLTEAFDALKAADWFDKSDLMTDYFNTAYYYDINIGKWNKPYEVAA